MLFDVKDELKIDIGSNNVTIKSSKEENKLGITFESKLDFSRYLRGITKKANVKFDALTIVKREGEMPS